MAPRTELLIWWTTDRECQALGAEAPQKLPAYIRDPYRLRSTQEGRGRLWAHAKAGEFEISEWPMTSIAEAIKLHGGVVFPRKDLALFTDDVPGIVTDFRIRVLVVT